MALDSLARLGGRVPFAHGLLGLGKDEADARMWFEKMSACDRKDCPEEFMEKAREWLRQH